MGVAIWICLIWLSVNIFLASNTAQLPKAAEINGGVSLMTLLILLGVLLFGG